MKEAIRLTDDELKSIKDLSLKESIYEKLLSHIEVLNEEIEELEDSVSEKDEEISDLEYSVDELQDEVKSLENQIEGLEEDLEDYSIIKGYNTLPYVFMKQTLDEVLFKKTPQEVEKVLRLLL